MIKKDIYKIDNYLIRFGIVLIVIGLLSILMDPSTYNDVMYTKDNSSYKFTDFNGRTLQQLQAELGPDVKVIPSEIPIVRIIITLSGIFMLIFGTIIRKKETKLITVWDALEKTSQLKVSDLMVSIGSSRDFILNNLKEINAQSGAYYVYISEKDSIVDGKLMQEHAVSLQCPGCGTHVNVQTSLAQLDKLSCNYCGAAVPAEHLAKLRTQILDDLETERKILLEENKKAISLPTFILLLIFFWPGAIVYYMYKKGISMKRISQKMHELQNTIHHV